MSANPKARRCWSFNIKTLATWQSSQHLIASSGLLLQDLLYQWGVSQFFFNVWQTLGRS